MGIDNETLEDVQMLSRAILSKIIYTNPLLNKVIEKLPTLAEFVKNSEFGKKIRVAQ